MASKVNPQASDKPVGSAPTGSVTRQGQYHSANSAKPIPGSVAYKPTSAGVKKIPGAVTGPKP